MSHQKEIGNLGENLAIRYILENGFQLLYQNWRYKYWEVDIIALKNNTIHFIEVKTRQQSPFGFPEDSIQLLYVTGQFPFPGFYSYQLLNYLFLSVLVLAGWLLKGKNYTTLVFGALAGPTVYFLLSNFTVWATHGGYNHPMNASGLWLCMVDGLPFYKNSLMATLLFVPMLLIIYHALLRKKLAIKMQ